MTGNNSNAGSPLPPNLTLEEQLEVLKDGLDHLSHNYQFFLNAVEALTNTDNNQSDADDWHLGMWLTGLWIGQQCHTQLERVLTIQEVWEEHATHPGG